MNISAIYWYGVHLIFVHSLNIYQDKYAKSEKNPDQFFLKNLYGWTFTKWIKQSFLLK